MFRKDARLASRDAKIAQLSDKLKETQDRLFEQVGESRRLRKEVESRPSRLLSQAQDWAKLQEELQRAKQSAAYYKTRSQDLAGRHKIRDRHVKEMVRQVQRLVLRIESLEANLEVARLETQEAIEQSLRARELEAKLEDATQQARREHEKRVDLEITLLLDRNQIADLEQMLRDTESSSPELLEKLTRIRERNKVLRQQKQELLDLLVELGGDAVLIDHLEPRHMTVLPSAGFSLFCILAL